MSVLHRIIRSRGRQAGPLFALIITASTGFALVASPRLAAMTGRRVFGSAISEDETFVLKSPDEPAPEGLPREPLTDEHRAALADVLEYRT